jgi:hypothetical protein
MIQAKLLLQQQVISIIQVKTVYIGSLITLTIHQDIFFDRVYNPAAAIFFMISAITLSYSFACIARNFLIYEPEFIFPQALMQTQLFRTLRKDTFDKSAASWQLKLFAIVAVSIYLWEFLPEFVFPMLSSLAVICW